MSSRLDMMMHLPLLRYHLLGTGARLTCSHRPIFRQLIRINRAMDVCAASVMRSTALIATFVCRSNCIVFFLFISVSFSFKSKKMERQEYAEMFLNWLNFCSFLRWWGSCVSGGWVHCHSFMLLAAVRLISRPMKLKPSPGAIQSNRIWPPFLPTPFWLLCKFMLIGRTQRRQRVPPALYVPWSDQTSHFQRKWDESMKYSSENHSPRPLARTLRAKLNYWLKINAFHFHLQWIHIHSQTTHYFYQIISFFNFKFWRQFKNFQFQLKSFVNLTEN